MEKKWYQSPLTTKASVELENGFMEASIFQEENQQDDGVTIEGHKEGNTGDYSKIGWDDNTFNSGF